MSFLRQVILVVVLAGVGFGGWHLYTTQGAQLLGFGAPQGQVGPGGPGGPGGGGGRPPTAVLMQDARTERMETRVEAVGTTLAVRSVEVAAGATGIVREVLFEAGQVVEADAPLARLDEEIARADLAEARADLSEVRSRLERARTLRRNNTVAEATVEQLQAEEAAAIAEVERANKRLADRVIRAPFGGVVGFRQVEIGSRVREDSIVTNLDDLSAVEIEFTVSETLFDQVEIGQPVIARAAAFPGREFEGVVSTIDSRIDTTSRAFAARALLFNPDRALPAGMFMHLSLVLDARDALTVPEEAIVPRGGTTYVFVVVDGKAERREVSIEGRMAGRVAIGAGLQPGDIVVFQGQDRLQNGSAVRDASQPPPERTGGGGPPGQGGGRPGAPQS